VSVRELDRRLQPVAVAERLAEADPFPSFAQYMDRCLYDPVFGYYAAGRVRLGPLEHFSTYPLLLGPGFAALFAEGARSLLEELDRAGRLPADAELTLLELGGGDGTLAAHICEYIDAHRAEPAWARYAPRIRYLLGEVGAALRERQGARLRQHIAAGRAHVMPLDARMLDWEGPFHGVVLANELLTAFPCERIRITAPGTAHRVHVVPLVAGKIDGCIDAPPVLARELGLDQALDAHGLFNLLAGSDSAAALRRNGVVFTELEVPLELGWAGADLFPADLARHLEGIASLVQDLDALQALPTEVLWAEQHAAFVAGLGRLLHGEQRAGAALLVDYGGTSRFCLDPGATGSHLRVYGEDRRLMHRCRPYVDPGRQDLTYDLDFTAFADRAEAQGLNVAFYGHQRALEAPPVNLDELVAAETAGAPGPDLIERFRRAPQFQLLVLGAAGVSGARFGASDPWRMADLATVRAGIGADQVAAMLEAVGLPAAAAASLRPGADPVAALAERGLYDRRQAILKRLAARDLLAPPGAIMALPAHAGELRRAPDLALYWEEGGLVLIPPGGTRRLLVGMDHLQLLDELGEPSSCDALRERLVPEIGADGWRELERILEDLLRHGAVMSGGAAPPPVPDSAASFETHHALLRDSVRVDAYRRALAQCVHPGDRVVDAGTGTGVLALLAARAGAGQVIAIERAPVGRVAARLFEAKGVASRITLVVADFDGYMTAEPADVLVADCFGNLGHGDGVAAFSRLAQRVLRPGGHLIPRRTEVFAAPLCDPERFAERVGWLHAPVAGLDLSQLAPTALGYADSSRPIAPDRLLAAARSLGGEDLHCGPLAGREAQTAFELIRSGPVDGIGLYFTLDLSDGVTLDTGFGLPDTRWHQTWIPVPPMEAAVGDRFGLRVRFMPSDDADRRLALDLHCGIVRERGLDPQHRARVLI
jgi:SAM-dependent MidA family methyltransferase/SAM-dependent methyltransferase